MKDACHDPQKNAFHVQYLAKQMELAGGWIGRPLETDGRKILEGNHRVRAARYLRASKSRERTV